MPMPHHEPELLHYALDYAREGFPVFPVWGIRAAAPLPIIDQWRKGKLSKKEAVAYAVCACGKIGCSSPGKHPYTINGSNDASTNPDQIRAWFGGGDSRHIGLVMPPGMFALDFDTYVPGVQERLDQLRLQRIATLEQTSGAGGTHLIFSGVPDGFKFASHLDGSPGVDLIHAGQRYLVAEPSSHWTGQRYHFVNGAKPQPAPPGLLARVARGVRSPVALQRPSKPQSASDVPKGLLCPLEVTDPEEWAISLAAEVLEPAISNDTPGSVEPGHVTLARAACHLIAGCSIDEDTALEMLWEEFNPRCEPPWEDHEYEDFERTVRGAGAGAAHGYLLAPPGVRELADAAELRHAARALSTGAGPRNSVLSGAERVATLAAGVDPWLGLPFQPFDREREPEKAEPVIAVFGKGKVSAIVAYPGTAKTPFALDMLVRVALGLPWLDGTATLQRKCLAVLTEGATNARRKAQRIAHGLGSSLADIGERLEIVRAPSGFLNATSAAALCELCKTRGFGFVVVDTYGSALDGAIDRNANAFSDALKQLGDCSDETGIVFVVLLHTRKTKNPADVPSLQDIDGHNSIAGAVQAAVALTRPDPAKENTIDATCIRHVDGSFKPLRVTWADAEFAGSTSEGLKLALDGHDPDRWILRAVVEDRAEGDAGAGVEGSAQSSRRVTAQSALDYLQLCQDLPGVNQRDLEQHTHGLGVVKKRALFSEMRQAGLLKLEVLGRRHEWSVAPFSKERQRSLLEWGLRLHDRETR